MSNLDDSLDPAGYDSAWLDHRSRGADHRGMVVDARGAVVLLVLTGLLVLVLRLLG